MVTVSAVAHDAVPRRLAGAVADHASGPAPTRAGGRCSGSSSRCSLLLFVFVWLRGTLPRLRYDQFMRFGWKVLLPVNLVWILALAGIRVLQDEDSTARSAGASSAASLLVVLLVTLLWPDRKPKPAAAAAGAGRRAADGQLPAAADGPRRCRRARGRGAWSPQREPADGRWRRHAEPRHRREGELRWARSPARSRASGSPSRTCSGRSSRPSTRTSAARSAPRYHGRHILNRHPDGLEKCIGCELCAWACPADAIYVEGGDNTDEERFSPG